MVEVDQLAPPGPVSNEVDHRAKSATASFFLALTNKYTAESKVRRK